MRIRLLGTGGADGLPAFFSNTRVNDIARVQGGKDRRSRSAALIDGDIKIDFGPDTLYQIHRDQLDPRDWSAIVFTHSHADHLTVSELQYGLFPFNEEESLHWTIYANPSVLDQIYRAYPDWPMETVVTKSFRTFKHGDMTITPIYAHHMVEEDAQNLIFQRDGKTFLYGTDTGIWTEPTWEFLKDYKLDGLVIECTDGIHSPIWFGHLGIKEMLHVLDRLHAQGTIHSGIPVLTTHHSHQGDATHAELETLLQPHGVTVGYDGMEIEI